MRREKQINKNNSYYTVLQLLKSKESRHRYGF